MLRATASYIHEAQRRRRDGQLLFRFLDDRLIIKSIDMEQQQISSHCVVLVDLESDAPGLLAAQLSGFGDSSAIINIFCPIKRWPEYRFEVLKHGAERIRSERDNPCLLWMKIEDPISKRIVAAIQ